MKKYYDKFKINIHKTLTGPALSMRILKYTLCQISH
jgi:hypothetical protein